MLSIACNSDHVYHIREEATQVAEATRALKILGADMEEGAGGAGPDSAGESGGGRRQCGKEAPEQDLLPSRQPIYPCLSQCADSPTMTCGLSKIKTQMIAIRLYVLPSCIVLPRRSTHQALPST